MMDSPDTMPTLAEWRQLYEVATQVKELAPWEWMMEDDLFGVQDPDTSQVGFVSIMGALGEHYAVAVYLGPAGLYGFWHLQELGNNLDADAFFEIPQLQASFEDRNQLRAKDREIIKKLGLKFRGRQAWPQFNSFRPGYAPWIPDAAEVRFLTRVLQQTLHMTQRFEKDPSILNVPDDYTYLVRVLHQAEAGPVWKDQLMHVPPPEPATISLTMDVPLLEKLQQVPQSKTALEVDFFVMPTLIQEKGNRPYFPYILLVLDARQGIILGQEMLHPQPSLQAMWATIPLHLVQLLARIGVRPKEIKVRSALLYQLLQSLTDELQFKLKQVDQLPTIDQVKELLFSRFL